MSTVRAKFRVVNMTAFHNPDGKPNGYKVSMTPVTGGSEENKRFYTATPWGEIVLGTMNPDAAAVFVPGAEFFVDFTPADLPNTEG